MSENLKEHSWFQISLLQISQVCVFQTSNHKHVIICHHGSTLTALSLKMLWNTWSLWHCIVVSLRRYGDRITLEPGFDTLLSCQCLSNNILQTPLECILWCVHHYFNTFSWDWSEDRIKFLLTNLTFVLLPTTPSPIINYQSLNNVQIDIFFFFLKW